MKFFFKRVKANKSEKQVEKELYDVLYAPLIWSH